jgi:hypothetical protein
VTSLGDARRMLGLSAAADADAVRAARRRLAKQIHPDLEGGDAEAMRRLNEAAELMLAELDAAGASTARRGATGPHAKGGGRGRGPGRGGGAASKDVCSFVIEALPAVAFEALVVVTSWIGEVVVDEPPYQLDALLTDPLRCWCRLELLPDAGASTVSLTIAALPDEPLPDIDDVRDLWVASLNRLGR